MPSKPGTIVTLVGRLAASVSDDDLKAAEPVALIGLAAACLSPANRAQEEANGRLPEEQRPDPGAPGPTLRVVEGGRGGGAPAMWHRLHELHVREEAGTITSAEAQELR